MCIEALGLSSDCESPSIAIHYTNLHVLTFKWSPSAPVTLELFIKQNNEFNPKPKFMRMNTKSPKFLNAYIIMHKE